MKIRFVQAQFYKTFFSYLLKMSVYFDEDRDIRRIARLREILIMKLANHGEMIDQT